LGNKVQKFLRVIKWLEENNSIKRIPALLYQEGLSLEINQPNKGNRNEKNQK
jgi:hypothetical protein